MLLPFDETLVRLGLVSAMRQAKLILAAYSGGADSSCLLRLLRRWCGDNGIPLAAAHVNHGIRGEEADRDETFCRLTCEELGIPFYSAKFDVPRLAAHSGRGLEEEARLIRYRYFDELAERLTGSKDGVLIATAHNADDNLETVLFHLIRGTGTHGLCGIDPLRDGRYLRPLLRESGSDIRQWCAKNDVEYVLDSTNASTDPARNHLRLHVIPEMRKLGPDPAAAVSRMTSLLRIDDDYLNAEAASVLNRGSLTREQLTNLPTAVSSRVLRQMYERLNTDHATLSEVHVREMLRLAAEHEGGGSLSLPGGIVFTLERQSVSMQPAVLEQRRETPGMVLFRYPADGSIFRTGSTLLTFSPDVHTFPTYIPENEENIYKLSISASIRFDRIKGVLQIRHRLPGDRYRFGGMTRKVKKLLSDRKMTVSEKATLPVLFDEDGIVWIPGFPPRDGLNWTGEGKPLFIECRFANAN